MKKIVCVVIIICQVAIYCQTDMTKLMADKPGSEQQTEMITLTAASRTLHNNLLRCPKDSLVILE